MTGFKGALNVDNSAALFSKLEQEIASFSANPRNPDPAINALRDAYHLREWIWHDHLDGNPSLQASVTGSSGGCQNWNRWVNIQFPEFPILRDLCNGSKHFKLRNSGSNIREQHQSGWDTQPWDVLPWDAEGFYIELDDGRVLSVADLLIRVRDFWKNLFDQHAF